MDFMEMIRQAQSYFEDNTEEFLTVIKELGVPDDFKDDLPFCVDKTSVEYIYDNKDTLCSLPDAIQEIFNDYDNKEN